ncbi:uncharacterized protein EV422DRAFT_572284 [Fimicolochytrium jonesii]|uniref:uncharacterized protein n=1 Tax=Fimicolochytrium jonesii TaxID=1396493 RepID=UPI0022FE5C68|nr:uncharacterized protein EV422DRAFT_572284 [Fimicolochytrium jonesii]KAI8815941.1 hypothetical protein EV422DRAFT_572284 [Fimicolochytrium jonesii]
MPNAVAAEPRVRNQVHDAAIWRQTIHLELQTPRNWEKHWGFMRELYAKDPTTRPPLLPPLASTVPRAFASGLPSKLPPGLTTSPTSYTADLLSIHDIPRISRSLYPKQKYTFPATTQQEVGWAWTTRGEDEVAAREVERVLGADRAEKDVGKRATREVVREREREVAERALRGSVGDDEGKNARVVRFRTLERFGREARGQGDVLKWWGGCRESLP